jgi:hypothetical protein
MSAAESPLPGTPPVPPSRPSDLPPAAAPAAPEAAAHAAAPLAAKSDDDCLASLKNMGWDFEAAAGTDRKDQCVIDTPVRLKNLQLGGARAQSIAFPDKPVLACRFAVRFGEWIGDLAVPLTRGRLGSDLKAIETGPGFECRTRDNIPHAKMSAHASGIAVDIGAFDLMNGQHVAVTETADAAEVQLLSALRTSACGWFTTILGPGTDPYHATHWHFDIMQHGSSTYYRICE